MALQIISDDLERGEVRIYCITTIDLVQVPFKGTVRYAALNCHRGKELGPKDDCESWLYMMVDCCNEHGLPWRQEKEKKKVELRKEEARSANGKQRLFKPVSGAFAYCTFRI